MKQRRQKTFDIGGANNLCVCLRTHMLGYTPPGKFCKLDALRLLLRPLLAQAALQLSLLSVRLRIYDFNLYRRPHGVAIANF